MIFRDLLSKMILKSQDAEVIFDRDEPVGFATDLVLPRKRWFRRSHEGETNAGAASVLPNHSPEAAARIDFTR